MAVSIIPGPKLIAIKKLFNTTEAHIVFIKRRGCDDLFVTAPFVLLKMMVLYKDALKKLKGCDGGHSP